MTFRTMMAAGLLAVGCASQASALTFGLFFNDSSVAAETNLSNVVIAAGHTPAVLGDLSAPTLTGLDVLWILNGAQDAQPDEMSTQAAALLAFVQAGGVLIYHDRNVQDGDHDPSTLGDATTTLPGGAGITFVFDDSSAETQNIDILDPSLLVVDGPAGLLWQTTLDGGTNSNHGYAVASTLPAGVRIFSRTSPDEVVDFGFGLGQGFVYYSTIPLDYYLGGGGPAVVADAFRTLYAVNVAPFAAAIAEPDVTPTPEPGTLLLLGGGLLGLALRRRRR